MAPALATNRAQPQAIVNDLTPGLTDRRGTDPVTAIQAIVSFSHAGRCRDEAVFAALAGTCPVKPAAAGPSVTGSTAVRIALSTGPSTPSPLPGCAAALHPGLRRPPQS
jgi:hypothetical protein